MLKSLGTMVLSIWIRYVLYQGRNKFCTWESILILELCALSWRGYQRLWIHFTPKSYFIYQERFCQVLNHMTNSWILVVDNKYLLRTSIDCQTFRCGLWIMQCNQSFHMKVLAGIKQVCLFVWLLICKFFFFLNKM